MNVEEFKRMLLELDNDEIEQFKEIIKNTKDLKKKKEAENARNELKEIDKELYNILIDIDKKLGEIGFDDPIRNVIVTAFPDMAIFFKKKSSGNSGKGKGKVKDAVLSILSNNTPLSAKEVETEMDKIGVEYGKNYVPYLLRKLLAEGEIKRDDNKKYYI